MLWPAFDDKNENAYRCTASWKARMTGTLCPSALFSNGDCSSWFYLDLDRGYRSRVEYYYNVDSTFGGYVLSKVNVSDFQNTL